MNIVRNIPWRNLPIFIVGGGIALAIHGILHENAHAVAARILFRDVNPVITYDSFYFGGKAEWEVDYLNVEKFGYQLPQLTSLGRQLGFSASRALTSAAGPIANICLFGAASYFQSPLLAKVLFLSTYSYFAHPLLGPPTDFCKVLEHAGTGAYAALTIAHFATLVLAHRPMFQGTYAKVMKWGGAALLYNQASNILEKVSFSFALKYLCENVHATAELFSADFAYNYKMGYPSRSNALPLALAVGPLLAQGLVHAGLSLRSRVVHTAVLLPGITFAVRAILAMAAGSENEFQYLYKKGGLLPAALLAGFSFYTAARAVSTLYQGCKKPKQA